MSCLTPEQIDCFARGTLDAPLAADVEAHLRQCEACRRKVEQARAGEELLGKIKDLPESADASSAAGEAASAAQIVPADAEETIPPLFTSPPPDSFAGYQIIREIHRGGQGIVYQAIQKSTKRRVALKVLKEGPFATPSERARFEREVTILGQLSHPNIVTVHDSGESAGYFYFVMDYISGQPLDVWMASGERTVEETLRLFAKICEAVNAAHLHGIIHRDLKPGNIRIDPEGQPHVLDFGLAKVAVGQVSNGSQPLMMTVTGQFMGSLPWASPEQAEAAPGKVDIRTDVYSLGVILYQMLTSKFPYDVIGNMRDVLDRIMKTEPAKPSTFRVASPRSKGVASAPRHDVASAPRGRRRGQVPNRIGDEVDTIVLKCLSKERERRYQTAGELARDIGHYLQGEPIEAKRDSALYVLRKQLRKYKVPAVIAAIFVLLVSAGLVTSLSLWRQAVAERERAVVAEAQQRAERDRADKERDAAIAAKQDEEKQRTEATRQKKSAEERSERLRRAVYANQIALADSARQAKEIARAKELLKSTDADLRGWEWYYLGAQIDLSLQTWPRQGGWVRSMAFSRDGQHLILGGDRTLRLCAVETGTVVRTFGELEANTVAFSPDSRSFVSGFDDGSLQMCDLDTGAVLWTVRGHDNVVFVVAFSPDGQSIVSGGRDKQLRFWDAKTGATLGALGIHEEASDCMAVSPDGRTIAVGKLDGTASLWDIETRAELRTFRGHDLPVHSLAFSPDGRSLVTGSVDRTLKIWDTETGGEMRILRGHEAGVSSVAYSPDGQRIVSGSFDKTLKLWDAEIGTELLTLTGHEDDVLFVVFNHDGQRIASVGLDGACKLWDVDTSIGTRTLARHGAKIASVVFSSDGRFVSSGAVDGSVKLLEAATGAESRGQRADIACSYCYTLPAMNHEIVQYGCAVRFSADGRRVAIGDLNGSLMLRDTATGAELWTINGHEDAINVLAFSYDTRRIASGGADSILKIWDTKTGFALLTLRGHEDVITAAAFSPDGRRLATGDGGGTLRLWDVDAGAELRPLQGHKYGITSVVFSPDGRRLASGSYDKTVRFWDAETGAELLTMRHADFVGAVAIGPDGRRLASGDADGSLKLWDTDTGAELLTLRGELGGVTSIAFSPDDRRIVTGTQLGYLIVWDCATEIVRSGEQKTLRTAYLLNETAWNISKLPSAEQVRYEQACRAATDALQALPTNGPILNTLGVTHYRLGQYQEALATLTKSDQIHSQSDAGPQAADAAFLAMTLHRLGRIDEARQQLDRLRGLVTEEQWANDEEARAFLHEAESLILGTATSGPAAALSSHPAPPPSTDPTESANE